VRLGADRQSIARITAALIVALFLPTQTVAADGETKTTGSESSDGGSLTDWITNLTEPEAEVTSGQDSPSIDEVQNEAYNGPKARVAVSRFTDKSGGGWYSWQIGEGMADQMATALFNSNRYIVLERQQLGDVLAEQDLGASGRVKTETAAAIGEIEGAELLITGAVTEFQGNASGSQGSLGGLVDGTLGNLLGAVSGGYSDAHMAIDVRVIDTKTSRIVAATSVEGTATDVNLGGALGGYGTGGALRGSLSGWKNTPIEKALRICIQKAVEFIVSKTPEVYYRHGAGAQVAAATASTGTSAGSQTKVSPNYAAGQVARVKSASLNMRSGPTTGHGVVASLPQDTPLLVQAKNGDWIQVTTPDGQNGWIAAWLTYPDATLDAQSFATQAAPAAVTPAAAEPAAQPAAVTVPANTGDSGASKAALKEKLKALKEFHEEGLISDEEYNAKRQEILSQF